MNVFTWRAVVDFSKLPVETGKRVIAHCHGDIEHWKFSGAEKGAGGRKAHFMKIVQGGGAHGFPEPAAKGGFSDAELSCDAGDG